MLLPALLMAQAAWQPMTPPHMAALRPMATPQRAFAVTPARHTTSPVMEFGESVSMASSLVADHPNLLLAGACVAFAYYKTLKAWGIMQPAHMAPSYSELHHAKLLRDFKYLQADLRLPLPSLAELQDACHRIGTARGRTMYLCTTAPSPGCQVNTEFSEYYKQNVWLCDEHSFSSS